MSSKIIHKIAGLATGVLLAFSFNADALQSALVLLGAHMGASAPDWMEVPRWVTKRRWFGPSESHRTSWIAHRTITHTLSLWVVATVYCVYMLVTATHVHAALVACAFCLSSLSHLLLDIRTPMGIPLFPFGRRYRLHKWTLKVAGSIEARGA